MFDRVLIEAPAKVNLRLKVLAQQTSGYHSLETIFCAISLVDSIEMERGGGAVELQVEGNVDVGPTADNLVLRAARRFFLELGGVGDGVRITLLKRIPAAAGLGGGSSDAASALRALNALHGSPLPPATLLRIGGDLGSDVPFFLSGSPVALGWSRGERLLPLDPLPPRNVVVASPGVPIPTGQAFQRIAELRGGGFRPEPALIPHGSLASWQTLAPLAANDFEEPAIERVPSIATARAALLEAGAEIALLAGSGSALFGCFASATTAQDAAVRLERLGFRVWTGLTLDSLPAPRLV